MIKKLIFLMLTALVISCSEPNPEVAFVVSLATPDAGQEIEFFNNTRNGHTYEWDFGDGTKSTEENPKKTYTNKGKYTVTLTATSKKGSKKDTKALDIQVNSTANFISADINNQSVSFYTDDTGIEEVFSYETNLAVPPAMSNGIFGTYIGKSNSNESLKIEFGKFNFEGSSPDSTIFKTWLAPGNKLFRTSDENSQSINIIYNNGSNSYSSRFTSQGGSVFNIAKTTVIYLQGNDYYKVEGSFSCKLKNDSGSDVLTVINGKFKMNFSRTP